MGEIGEKSQKVKNSSYRMSESCGCIMHSMMTAANNTVLRILKVPRKWISKVLLHKEKKCNCVW